MGVLKKWQREKSENPMTREAVVLGNCIADLTDASTPRPPQVEWFEKWDAWWVSGTPESYSTIFREVETFEMGGGTLPKLVMVRGLMLGSQVPTCWHLSQLGMVVPVRREGPPAMDVGWDAVGG